VQISIPDRRFRNCLFAICERFQAGEQSSPLHFEEFAGFLFRKRLFEWQAHCNFEICFNSKNMTDILIRKFVSHFFFDTKGANEKRRQAAGSFPAGNIR